MELYSKRVLAAKNNASYFVSGTVLGNRVHCHITIFTLGGPSRSCYTERCGWRALNEVQNHVHVIRCSCCFSSTSAHVPSTNYLSKVLKKTYKRCYMCHPLHFQRYFWTQVQTAQNTCKVAPIVIIRIDNNCSTAQKEYHHKTAVRSFSILSSLDRLWTSKIFYTPYDITPAEKLPRIMIFWQ